MMAASSDRCLFEGLHFYCFGGFRRTLRWARAIERGEFEVLLERREGGNGN